MKVNNIPYVGFRSSVQQSGNVLPQKHTQDVKELTYVTPDFGINVPQAYKKLGVKTLENGLSIHSYKLANGYRVTVVPMEDSPAVVKNYVNVGSMNEPADIKGISHFLEHMAFNGTNGENGHMKLEVGDLFKKIDELGGWANASTNYAITDYVNSTPQLKNNDLEKQIKIIAAMTEDLKLSDDMIAKEKSPVCSEINMILDEPQTIALDQTVRTLFNIKNPADEMVGGSVKHIKNLTRQDVMDYYNKYYTPDNMNLVITGDVNPDEVIQLVAKNFNSCKISTGKKFEEKLVPLNKTVRKDFKNDKAVSTEIVLGFSGPANNDLKENVLFDTAKTYLESYTSGLKQNLKRFNSYPYIDSEKISTNPNSPRMAYLAATSSEENSEKVLKTIFDTIYSLKSISDTDLNNIKEKILTQREEAFEYSDVVNDNIGKAVLNGNLDFVTEYEKVLHSLTPQDVDKAVKKYFDLNKTAITVVHPISFKGRTPINNEKLTNIKLDNNFEAGLYETKSNNINYNISLYADKPYNKKAGVAELLNEIYAMGTESIDEEGFNKFQEDNNIVVSAFSSNSRLKIYTKSGLKNRNIAMEKAEELLYHPRITQQNLDIAKERIKDRLNRLPDTAYNLYMDYDSQNNLYEFSVDEILSSLDSVTLRDVQECHEYLLNNSRGIITANLPEECKAPVKQEIIHSADRLKPVKPNDIEIPAIYKENAAPKVLSKANNNSQADIMQVYKFKCDNTIKESAVGEIMNSILTNSSIGLFNTLREKEHLAYSVYSSLEKDGDAGMLSCNISTTTDNKDIGEISYDNVPKSIEGFFAQINALKQGLFTDQDIENAKLAMKSHLLNNEGTASKLGALNMGMNSKFGIEYANKLYDIADKITREDIIEFANKVFASNPVYSITATQDTLDYNKNYLNSLV